LTKIFKNSSQVLFVSKADHIEKRAKYTVILSPEFYWVKKVTLPVKKERDALKLAPSIYEGYLPEGVYSYEARKLDDSFIMIAYDKKEISKALDKIFPHRSDIVDIYFAQDALLHIDECLAVNDQIALSNMDGTIIQIPRACTNTQETLAGMIDKATLGKRKVKLSSFDNALLSSKEIMLIATIFGLLFLSFLAEYFVYKKELNRLEEKRMALIKEYHLPPTSMQLKSIKKSLHKKFERQKRVRELLFALSKLSLKPGEYIGRIEESPKEMIVEIYITSKEREDAIKKMLPKDIRIKESHVDEQTLTLKIAS
jgi:hypothetical protein